MRIASFLLLYHVFVSLYYCFLPINFYLFGCFYCFLGVFESLKSLLNLFGDWKMSRVDWARKPKSQEKETQRRQDTRTADGRVIYCSEDRVTLQFDSISRNLLGTVGSFYSSGSVSG